ncbi:hypothetical protein [Halobellus ordinarius]|uniref:hypothetical protein n=1 Tax=Halobellus ordinarius TaxID=3075120 RepID=UPI00288085FE|nr:hypothetical protein [Halobellus sp. ZY16]
MDFDWLTYFDCAACGTEFPTKTVQYDELGYPVCPDCEARTGPLASLEAVDAAQNGIAD